MLNFIKIIALEMDKDPVFRSGLKEGLEDSFPFRTWMVSKVL
jgi:hypothetical protein